MRSAPDHGLNVRLFADDWCVFVNIASESARRAKVSLAADAAQVSDICCSAGSFMPAALNKARCSIEVNLRLGARTTSAALLRSRVTNFALQLSPLLLCRAGGSTAFPVKLRAVRFLCDRFRRLGNVRSLPVKPSALHGLRITARSCFFSKKIFVRKGSVSIGIVRAFSLPRVLSKASCYA